MTLDPAALSLTADALLRLRDDDHRCELVRGQLVRDSPAGGRHGLGNWAAQHNVGVVLAAETGFRLRRDPDTVRAPDVAFVTGDCLPADGVSEGFWDGPPDLAVEVLSPADRMADVLDKVRDYLDTGAAQVWIVSPRNATVTLYTSTEVRVLAATEVLVGEGPLAGFRCGLRDLFAQGREPS